MQVSKHFQSEEFISKKVHAYIVKRGWSPRGWCRRQIVDCLEHIYYLCELEYGVGNISITVNNYKWGGVRNWSGLRTWLSKWSWALYEWGNNLSQHRFMNAVDIQVFQKVDGRNIQIPSSLIAQIIKDNFTYLNTKFELTTMENPQKTKGWTHLDWRWTDLKYLLIVNP